MGKTKKLAKSAKTLKEPKLSTPASETSNTKNTSTLVSSFSPNKKELEKTTRKKALFLTHFTKTKGVITPAAKAAGITRRTVLNWRKEDKAFNELFLEAENQAVEYVESEMLKQIKKGNTTLTIFYLINRSKGRWENTQKIEHKADESQMSKIDTLLDKTAHILKLSKKAEDV